MITPVVGAAVLGRPTAAAPPEDIVAGTVVVGTVAGTVVVGTVLTLLISRADVAPMGLTLLFPVAKGVTALETSLEADVEWGIKEKDSTASKRTTRAAVMRALGYLSNTAIFDCFVQIDYNTITKARWVGKIHIWPNLGRGQRQGLFSKQCNAAVKPPRELR
jgi:hypothetical protein